MTEIGWVCGSMSQRMKEKVQECGLVWQRRSKKIQEFGILHVEA